MAKLYRHEHTLAIVDFGLCPVERLAVESSSNDSPRRGTVGAEVGCRAIVQRADIAGLALLLITHRIRCQVEEKRRIHYPSRRLKSSFSDAFYVVLEQYSQLGVTVLLFVVLSPINTKEASESSPFFFLSFFAAAPSMAATMAKSPRMLVSFIAALSGLVVC